MLKPGGFIELSILDVDLNNIGNWDRRTVRRLKEGTNEKTPDTSLGLFVLSAGKADKGKAAAEKKNNPPSLSEMMSDNSPLLKLKSLIDFVEYT
ncbi:hypothetical protein FOWG_16974 [Fusarium oxysporum f. sp. lycopersici MN25]|nr:hypothetical protein FOWG_16974 [Fusarium oxysporum f. sp. lycopersici MN25]